MELSHFFLMSFHVIICVAHRNHKAEITATREAFSTAFSTREAVSEAFSTREAVQIRHAFYNS